MRKKTLEAHLIIHAQVCLLYSFLHTIQFSIVTHQSRIYLQHLTQFIQQQQQQKNKSKLDDTFLGTLIVQGKLQKDCLENTMRCDSMCKIYDKLTMSNKLYTLTGAHPLLKDEALGVILSSHSL
jgi:hypothetical protein